MKNFMKLEGLLDCLVGGAEEDVVDFDSGRRAENVEGGGGDVLWGEHVDLGPGLRELVFVACEVVVEEWGIDEAGRNGGNPGG